jgi:tol-pal system protein YbgF
MRILVLASFCLLLSSQVHAALFDDTEARRQIGEVQQQVTKLQSQNQALQAALDEAKKKQQALEERIAAMEAVLKGQGLLDLLNQNDRLNQDISKLKGQLEVATHSIDSTQQRQRDLYGDLDGRLRKLEGGTPAATSTNVQPAGAPAAAPSAVPDANAGAENKDFEAANALSKTGKFKDAFDAYDKFLQTYPGSASVPEAQYALGYAQFKLKNYKAAIATQQKLIKQFPDSPKQPYAMFNISDCQIQLTDIDGAKKTLHELLDKYPNSEVAPVAKKRLAVLESIKSK